ncbi:MAG: peptide ABC transporter permease [Alphaproteobacteria bacterium]|nr:MAG: peptide ABC transporter permease [Alphaproteobacteria bacterium]
MTSIFSQIFTVIMMNIRSLPRRLWMSFAATLAISVVVAVLLSFLSMSNGFKKTLEGAGSDKTAIVTRSGSKSELNSVLSNDVVNIITTAPGIAKNADGNPIYSAELYVIVDGIKRTTNTKANLPLRGIAAVGIDLRSNFEMIEGRMFETGRNEIIVGTAILREFSGFELGTTVKFGKSEWTVVGIFSTGGSAFESELWADARTLQSQFRRGNSFQTIRVLLEEPGNIEGMLEAVKQDPRLILDVQTEIDYFKEQGEALSGMVNLGWILSIVMSLGALAGALNTMYTSVADREREIATLRAIGFSNISAFFGTLTESLILSLIGGVIGTLAAYIFMDGLTTSTLGGNFTQVVFSFHMSADLFQSGIILALAIGLIGGFFPALRAARLPVVLAFRGGA